MQPGRLYVPCSSFWAVDQNRGPPLYVYMQQTQAMDAVPALLTEKQATFSLGISARLLGDWRREDLGVGPAHVHLAGRRVVVRYTQGTLDAFVRSCAVSNRRAAAV
ncbi:hypothetical protein GCM10009596_01930 [Arthrobacter rhombi]